MSTAILVLCGLMLVIALVVRSRQSKAEADPKQKKSSRTSSKSNAKTSKKVTVSESKTEQKAEEKPKTQKKPAIDVDNLLSQIDVMIADKQFAKAEGIINQTLNQDDSLEALYPKLLSIYQLQHDDFAIKQLLDNVKAQGLNSTYQTLFNEQEAYLEEQQRLNQLEPTKSGVIESTPTEQAPAPDFDALNTSTNTPSRVSVEPLEFDTPSDTIQTEPNNNLSSFDELTLDVDTPAIQSSTDNAPLEFNLSQETPAPVEPTEPTLEFKLDQDVTAPQTETQDLEFKLEEPTSVTPADTTNSLDFSLDTPTSSEAPLPTDTPALESTPTLDLDTPQAPTLDIEQPVAEEAVETTATETFADADDPIIQAFPALAQVNPIELDIELAEQYIRLGEIAAAKQLLAVDQAHLNTEQADKVQQLLQNIA